MGNSIFYQRIIVSTLVIVLLTYGVQSIGYGQLSISPDKIKDESTRYVVWIVTDVATDSGGSGVLIGKTNRLVVTNAHVTGDNKEVLVFFAVRDSSGDIVRARPFYKNKDHQSILKRLGYVTRGRVIAKYKYPRNEPDLAIIELDGLPETVSPLKLLTSIDYSKMKDEPVHILGHPAERNLWHWKAGFFKEDMGRDLRIFADAYYGNSGGPVLNKDGNLIGITRAIIEDDGITLAVPASAIIDLYRTLEPVRIFSIYNNTEFPMSYEVKWKKDEDWAKELLEPKKEFIHSLPFKEISDEYPKIRYENSQDRKESSKSVQELETKFRFFGIGINDTNKFDDHIEINDALRYQFKSDPETKKISLVKMKLIETFMIHNNTKSSIFFQFRWHEDDKWEEEYIKSNDAWRYGQPSEKVSPGYPKIRFDESQGDRKYPERSSSLLTQTGYFDKTTKIKDDIKQMSSNPPLYYQFKNNIETNGIFLDEMRRTQTFSIQNATESYLFFTYRWHENDKWEQEYINPNETKFYSQPSEKVSADYPKTRYSSEKVSADYPKISNVEIAGDNKSAEKIERLETQTRYFGKNTKITDSPKHLTTHGYHFKYNSETKKLSLHQGLLTISKKSKGRSFPLFTVVLIAVLIIEALVTVILVVDYYFPKRHIFSLQNNTESSVNYHVKWTKKGGWKSNSLDPSKSRNHRRTGFFKKSPEIAYDQIVNDEKRTIAVKLETRSRRIRRNAETQISSEDARKYRFDSDPETNKLTLYDSE